MRATLFDTAYRGHLRSQYRWTFFHGCDVESVVTCCVRFLGVFCGECNGLPMQTEQCTFALRFSSVCLGWIEWESAPLCPILRSIVPHLIAAPIKMPPKHWKIHRGPMKEADYWLSHRRGRTLIAQVISWEGNIKGCIGTPMVFFRATKAYRY